MREMIGWIIFVLMVVVALSGFLQVKEKERVAVEFFGKFFKILRPGLNWIFPGIMQIKEKVLIQEQSLPLFEIPIKIDFSDGWAVPKNAEVFIEMESPDMPYSVDGNELKSGAYRAIYEIENWRKAIQRRLENAVRTHLNRFTIDEAITMGKAGFNLANHDPDVGLPNPELEEIEKVLKRWGWQLKTVTVGDFDLDPKIIEARSKVHREKKASEASSFVVQRQAKEWVGMIIETMAQSRGKTIEEIQAKINSSTKLQREFLDYAKMINLRLEEAERNAVVHVVVDGNGGKDSGSGGFLDDVEKRIIRIFAARERMPKGKPKTEEETEEKEEKEKEQKEKEEKEEEEVKAEEIEKSLKPASPHAEAIMKKAGETLRKLRPLREKKRKQRKSHKRE